MAFGNREECVIAATLDVVAGLESSPPLANEDGTRRHQLSIADLRPEALGLGIPAVATGALSFLVCHDSSYASMLSTRTR